MIDIRSNLGPCIYRPHQQAQRWTNSGSVYIDGTMGVLVEEKVRNFKH